MDRNDAKGFPLSPEPQAEFDDWERASDETMARLDAEEDAGWRDKSEASVTNGLPPVPKV